MDSEVIAPQYHLNFPECVPEDARKYINTNCEQLRKDFDKHPETRAAINILHKALKELATNSIFQEAWELKPNKLTASSYFGIFFEYMMFIPKNNLKKTKENKDAFLKHIKNALSILQQDKAISFIADLALHTTIETPDIFPIEIPKDGKIAMHSAEEFLKKLIENTKENNYDSHRYLPPVKRGKAAERHFYALKFSSWVQCTPSGQVGQIAGYC